MNLLKPMLLMVVLGGIGYGVYTVLNKGPAPEPPPGIAKDWSKPLDIQMGTAPGGPSAGAPSSPWNGGGGSPPLLSDKSPFNGPSPATATSGPLPASLGALPAMPTPVAPPPVPIPAGGALATDSPVVSSIPPAPPLPTTTGGNVTPTSASLPSNPDPIGGAPSAAPPTGGKLDAVLETVRPLLEDGKLAEALRMLTRWYESPQFTPEESHKLDDTLARLAGTVVYSRKHLLRAAYEVRPGDRLETIANQYKVPWQLLAKINGIDDPNKLVPGERLKVVQGPFMALVEVDKKELTLTVEGCYAGKMKLNNVGDDAQQLSGAFEVTEKKPDIGSGQYGPPPGTCHWIGIGGKIGIHTIDSTVPDNQGLNVSLRDNQDVYDILSIGSQIVIRR